jgi:hypothetical protein
MKGNQELREAIGDAFRSTGQLEILVNDLFYPHRLQDISALPLPLPQIVYNLISWCEEQGKLIEFVLGAKERNPGNPKLMRVTAGLRGTLPPSGHGELGLGEWRRIAGPELERIVLPNVRFEDGMPWLDRLSRIMRRVCRVEPRPPAEGIEGFGSGFLVAPDVVMTNHHVVVPFLDKGWERVILRFDFHVDAERVAVGRGRPVALAQGWQLLHDRDLDFALIRITERVADDQVRGQARGVVDLTQRAFEVGDPMVIVQHPCADPVKLAIGSVIARAGEHEVTYTANTEGGSSGSPCLTMALDAVAIHHRGGAKGNRGVQFSAIRRHLVQRKKQLEAAGLQHLID